MPKGETEIVVEPDLIRVHYDSIGRSPHGRFYAGLFCLAFIVGIICFIVFLPGKHGEPGIWQDLSGNPVGSSGFLFPFLLIAAIVGGFTWFGAKGLLTQYPGAQKLECDGQTLTLSRLRWFDWHNQDWIAQSFALRDVSRIRYGVIVQGRGNSTWGLRLTAGGKGYKLFPKLTTGQAGKILAAFESMGADTDRLRKAARRKQKRSRMMS